MKQSLVLMALVLGACGGEATTTSSNNTNTSGIDASAPDSSATPDMSNTNNTPTPDAGADLSPSVDAGEDAAPDAMVSLGSPGCVDGAGIPEGENTFMLDGNARKFIMRLPENYTADKAWPVVFALHGNGGSTAYWDGTTGDRNIRGVLKDKAILIVAEAIDGQWRDYNADPSTWPARIDLELNYFDKILEDTRNNLCVNNDAIFTMGFSGGGSFSGVLSCYREDYRAMAVGGSVIYFDPNACVGKSEAWITIGTQELVAGREQFRDFFRDRAGCAATATATDPSPCTRYNDCDEGLPVDYCQHPDGHIWPNFGSQAMWDFFSQFVEVP